MTYKLAIFDFDGTLADSLPWLLQIVNQVADRYDFRRVSPHELETLRGAAPREMLAHVGLPVWKLPLVARHVRKLMARDIEQIQLFPGVPEMLEALARGGVELAIVTSNSKNNVRRILGPHHAGFIRHYACNASMFGKRRKLRGVIRASGVARHEIISIGDEVRDVHASHAEELAFGAVTWGYASPEALLAYKPREVFHRIEDIAARVG